MFGPLLADVVVLKTMTPTPGPTGTTVQTPSAGTTFNCSVQLGDAVAATDQGRRSSTLDGRIFFTARPVDTSAGARVVALPGQKLGPEVNVNDTFTWQVDPYDRSQDRLLVAQGRATPQGGFSVAWSVAVSGRT